MSHGHTMTLANGGHVLAQHAAPEPEPEASHVPDGAHEMPSGNWVRIADPHTITRGDKKALVVAVKDQQTPVEVGFAIADVLLARLIVEWSYALPLPSADPAALDQIPGSDDEAISDLIKPARALLFPSLPSPDQHADPNSPTAPSGA